MESQISQVTVTGAGNCSMEIPSKDVNPPFFLLPDCAAAVKSLLTVRVLLQQKPEM